MTETPDLELLKLCEAAKDLGATAAMDNLLAGSLLSCESLTSISGRQLACTDPKRQTFVIGIQRMAERLFVLGM